MRTGFIWGKFMPLHRGHIYLIDYARERVHHLTVLVCSVASQPIPGELRHQWVKELYPDVNVQHCADPIPQYPHEHPDFWAIWRGVIRCFLPSGPDVVFTSEVAGDKLAEVLGARHVCVDLERRVFPVSGTAVRSNPEGCWDFIPPSVRAYYKSVGRVDNPPHNFSIGELTTRPTTLL